MFNFLKNILKRIFMPGFLAKEITPQYLEAKRAELLTTEKYIKWLRSNLMFFEGVQQSTIDKGIRRNPLFDQAIELLKKELDKDEYKYYPK